MVYTFRDLIQPLVEKHKTTPHEVETGMLNAFLYNAELALKKLDKLEYRNGELAKCKTCDGKGHHDIERDGEGSFCLKFCETCKGLGEVIYSEIKGEVE